MHAPEPLSGITPLIDSTCEWFTAPLWKQRLMFGCRGSMGEGPYACTALLAEPLYREREGLSYSDWRPRRSCWCCGGQRIWWAMREHQSPKNHPPLPPSLLHAAVFGIRLQAPTLRPPWSSYPSLLTLSLCMTDGRMTSTHVPLLPIHPFLSVSLSSDGPLSWLSCSGISPPSPFLAASSTSQTCAHFVPSVRLPSPVSLSFYFPPFLSACLSLDRVFDYQHLPSANTPPRSHGLFPFEPDVMDKEDSVFVDECLCVCVRRNVYTRKMSACIHHLHVCVLVLVFLSILIFRKTFEISQKSVWFPSAVPEQKL